MPGSPPASPRPARFGFGLGHWRAAGRFALPPLFTTLPGAGQRRRLLLASLLAGSVWLLRPWPPLQWLPGWCVGLLLLWALVEWVAWLWSPQRSA